MFKLDDKSATLEASVDEATLAAAKDVLKDDEFVVLQGKVQHDHFSGGLRIKGLPRSGAWPMPAAAWPATGKCRPLRT